MIKLIKALFSKTVVNPRTPVKAKGEIMRNESLFSYVSLVHNGGDLYTIFTGAKDSKNSTGVFRRGEARAISHFRSTCFDMNAIKSVEI